MQPPCSPAAPGPPQSNAALFLPNLKRKKKRINILWHRNTRNATHPSLAMPGSFSVSPQLVEEPTTLTLTAILTSLKIQEHICIPCFIII